MSGICGAWSFAGDTPDLSPILAQLQRRGPDGTKDWYEGPIALGHTLLATTPEALVELLPLIEPISGCIITADARLDNREELIGKLHLGSETRLIGDGELILRAYLRWGEDCPRHLLGDFAFAIWDENKQRLFCARDQMGMRQLIYHHAPGRLFAFATEADALVAHPSVPGQINQGRIADYLDDLEGIDLDSTFYEDVFRLPPAHALSLVSTGLTLRCYWTLQPGVELKLDTDQDYADAFLEVFIEAVRCRLRSPGPVGFMLSGGLDSCSIVAVAAALLAEAGRGQLPTFSAIGSCLDDCPESAAIRVAIQSPMLSPALLRPEEIRQGPPEVLLMTQQCAEPFDGSMVITKAVYGAARRSGLKVVLDGAGADVILTAGNRVADLLSQGKLLAAAREARLEAQFWGPVWPVGRIFWSASWAMLAPAWLRRLRWRLAWWGRDVAMRLGRNSVSRNFAQAVDLTQRRNKFRLHWWQGRPIGSAYRAHSVRHPHLVVARERYDRVASAFAIEARDPFMDIRLIKFALSLPPDQLQAGGWPKIVLRRAMAGRVRTEIAWRRGKPHLGWRFTSELISQWMAIAAEQANGERVMELIGSRGRWDISSGPNRAAWLKNMILKSWLDKRSGSGKIDD